MGEGYVICKQTDSNVLDDGSIQITFTIKEIDNWKFMRWIDLMNAYDDMRKSTHEYSQLIKEIGEDYDKDFKEEDDKGYV